MRPSAPVSLKQASLLVVFGVLVGFVVVEVAMRIATGMFGLAPHHNRYGIVDPVVGRIPRDGVKIRLWKDGSLKTITTGAHGTRMNGDAATRAERPLMLAVGDSFTFGDEVDDNESWPALLEQLTGRRVINAGVPGFGLDQSVLRAEQLAKVYAPDVIIVSFIPHDVERCQLSYWYGRAKPYFEIDSSGLHLRPPPSLPQPAFAPLRRLLSLSVAADIVLGETVYWEGPEMMVVHERGKEVACLLMERLAALSQMRQVPVIVLAQSQQLDPKPDHREIKDGVLACAAAQHLRTLDLFPTIERLPPERRAQLFDHHMTSEGNHLVAAELASFLERNLVLEEGAPRDQ